MPFFGGTDAIKAGDAYWRISADQSELETGLAQAETAVQASTQRMAQATRMVGVAFTAIGGAITGGVAAAIKGAADFETAIANAASVTGKTGDEFDKARAKMEELAQTLGGTTVFSASEAANAFYDLSSKGFDVASMSIEELRPLLDLAAATQSDLTTTTEITTGTLRAFGMENKEMVRIADVFALSIGTSAATIEKLGNSMVYVAPVAAAAGVSFEDLTANLSKLYDASFDGSMAGTALRMTISTLMAPNKQLGDVLERLGLTMEDINLKTHSLGQVIETMAKAGFNATDAMEVFGQRAGPAMIALLGVTDQTQKLTTELENAGGVAHTIAEVQLNTLAGQLKVLESAFEAVWLPIGKMFIPTLTKLTQKLSVVLQALSAWMQNNPQIAQGIVMVVTAIGVLMTAVGPLLIMLPGLAMLFGALSGPVLAVAAGIGAALVGAILILKANWDKMAIWIKANWEKIKAVMNQTYETLRQIIAMIGQAFTIFIKLALISLQGWAIEWGRGFANILDISLDFQGDMTGSFRKLLAGLEFLFRQINVALGQASAWMSENWDSMVRGARIFHASIVRPIVFVIQLIEALVATIVKLLDICMQLQRFLAYGNFMTYLMQLIAMFDSRGGGGRRHARRAAGGLVSGDSLEHELAMVGERGPELVALPAGARVLSHEGLMSAARQGVSATRAAVPGPITFDLRGTIVRSEQDINTLVYQIGRMLERKMNLRGVHLRRA